MLELHRRGSSHERIARHLQCSAHTVARHVVLGGEPRHGHSSAHALVLDTCETIQNHQAHRQTPVQQPDRMSGAAQTGAAPAGLLAEALRCRGADNHEAN